MLLLKPLHMMNTFPVGFVFGELPGPEGYHFDCGCVLDQQGRASRNRPPLENTHLHFVACLDPRLMSDFHDFSTKQKAPFPRPVFPQITGYL